MLSFLLILTFLIIAPIRRSIVDRKAILYQLLADNGVNAECKSNIFLYYYLLSNN